MSKLKEAVSPDPLLKTPAAPALGALQKDRLISLDILRGVTIAAMILVNFPGDDEHVFEPLRHSAWNGLSPTDTIAPFFLFIVGVSIAFAYTKRLESGLPKGAMYRKIVIRSAKIFAVGMILNMLPDFNLADLRWTGTLHRISIVFLACAFLFLNTNWRTQAWIGATVLGAYWLVMTTIPTPGYGQVMLEPGANLAAWIDSQFLPGKMWQGTWDPEGILSTFPAIVTGITGLLAGRLMLSQLSRNEKSNYLMVSGLAAATAGYLWGLHFPVNENIWTSSFVLVTSGMAVMLLGAVYFLVDIKGYSRGTKPWLIFGANAIAVYVIGNVLSIPFYKLPIGNLSLNAYFQEALTSAGLAPKVSSVLYATLFAAAVFVPAYLLFRKKIFIKL
jgi:predicted acyltransferase